MVGGQRPARGIVALRISPVGGEGFTTVLVVRHLLSSRSCISDGIFRQNYPLHHCILMPNGVRSGRRSDLLDTLDDDPECRQRASLPATNSCTRSQPQSPLSGQRRKLITHLDRPCFSQGTSRTRGRFAQRILHRQAHLAETLSREEIIRCSVLQRTPDF